MIHESERTVIPGLPPGLPKKLARGASLPSGWEKKRKGEIMPVKLTNAVVMTNGMLQSDDSNSTRLPQRFFMGIEGQ